jgi:spermidine synthase
MRHKPLFPEMWRVVPQGHIGSARVEHFDVSQFQSQMSALRGMREFVSRGTYAKLIVDGVLMMSDTDYERRTNATIACTARGTVLIAGLGLGMLLTAVLKRADVKRVVCVEQSADVIALVAPAIRSYVGPRAARKLTIVQGDIWDDATREHVKTLGPYDVQWFDIWADTSTDTLADMASLGRKYRAMLADGGDVDHWNRGYLRWQRDQHRGY